VKCETNRSGPAFALACLIFCFLGVANAWSQSKSQPKPEAEIIISTLFPPVYPPLAKQTRISGEVQLIVEVGKDGSVTAPVAFNLGQQVTVRRRLTEFVVFSLAELDAGIVESDVIVADTMDGAPLGDKLGPFRLVAPHEKRPARWVRMLKSLTVVRATVQ